MCPVELAATLVINKGSPLVTVTHVIIYPQVFLLGFVCQSLPHLPLVALNVPQLHILNKIYPTLLLIAAIIEQGRSS
jgi:hypothetical protein